MNKRDALETALSDALSAMTEGGEEAQAPDPSDEPGSPYVVGLAGRLSSGLAASGWALVPVALVEAAQLFLSDLDMRREAGRHNLTAYSGAWSVQSEGETALRAALKEADR